MAQPLFSILTNLGDGQHDHVVIAGDELVSAALGDVDRPLVEAERRSGVALDEHVAAGSLVCIMFDN